MSTLLIEIGCEELPYRVCESLLKQLAGDEQAPGLVATLLSEARLVAERPPAEVLISPRRIAVLVNDLPERQLAKVDEFRGPKAEIAFDAEGELTKAGQGFARSRGVVPEDVRREVVDGTEFAVVRVEAAQQPTSEVVPDLVGRLIGGLQISRGMRWGRRPAGETEYLKFSRPIRWIVLKLDGETLEGSFYGLPFGDRSRGHRVLGGEVAISLPGAYRDLLREQGVIVAQDERRRQILEQLDAAAATTGGEWFDPGNVLSEAVYLSEWPSVAVGSFAESHLRLPEPVLVTAMQSHQRYFPLRAGEALLPAFLYVSNADPQAAELVTRGNERVLDGRLDDAEFAYGRDLDEGLAAMAERLGAVVFHERLGSLADKSARLEALVVELGAVIGAPARGIALGDLQAAARLAKADLVSQVVIEFPVLQGTMGGLYAAAGEADESVALAVGEHYRPLSTTAPLTSTLAGAVLAIVDKLDNIVGAWVAGQKPSGSRDPYGLRRAAMGIVRSVLEYELRFDLDEMLAATAQQFADQGTLKGDDERRQMIITETGAFIRERLAALLLEQGLAFTVVEAALAAPSADLCAAAARARVIAAAVGRPAFEDAVIAYNRCAALAAKAEPGSDGGIDPALFVDGAEQELAAAFAAVRDPLLAALDDLDVERAIDLAAGLRPVVDTYFDAVLVMDGDPAVRANRLAQLAAVAELVGQIGEFSRLPAA